MDKELNILVAENFFEKIIGRNEMIRVLDEKGNEIYNISVDLPDIQHDSLPRKNGFSRMQIAGENVLLLRASLKTDSFSGSLEVGTNVETFDTFMEKVIWVLMLGTILSLGLSLLSGRVLAGKLVSPLRELTNTMKKIEDLSIPRTCTRNRYKR